MELHTDGILHRWDYAQTGIHTDGIYDERYGRITCMMDEEGRRETMYKSARATPVGASATASATA